MPETINAARLHAFAPQCAAEAIAPDLDTAARGYGIITPRRVRHWLAQLAVESCGFSVVEERLSYSAARLRQVWPARFPSEASTFSCAGNPKALAQRIYGNRMGNHLPTDGYDFRGRGYIQLTGRDNYQLAASELGEDYVDQPDLAADPHHAAVIAAWWWKRAGLNEIADTDDLEAVTRIVNGGSNGLEERRRQLSCASLIWPDAELGDV